MKKKIFFFLILLILGFAFSSYLKNKNPYSDVIWIKDYPGATERYVEYTPYLKSNPKIKISKDSFGTDYGELRFEDIDDDGIKETIIETKQPFYSFDDAVSPTKLILKYSKDKNNNPFFTEIKFENLSKKKK